MLLSSRGLMGPNMEVQARRRVWLLDASVRVEMVAAQPRVAGPSSAMTWEYINFAKEDRIPEP
jgi:hypothetical protein